MNETSADVDPQAVQGAPTPFKGLLILGAVCVVVAGYMWLAGSLGIKSQWGGFLFLFYWGGVEQARLSRLLANGCGALTGLAMCFALWKLPALMGDRGLLVFLGLLLVAMYLMIMGWLPVAINMMTMLYLTVGSIPAIQAGIDFTDVFQALLLGSVYFGGLAGLGYLLSRFKRSRKPGYAEKTLAR